MNQNEKTQRSTTLEKIVAKRIFLIRNDRVMLSPDLAELYQVETRALLQAVKRNSRRFPEDFMFQLTIQELIDLKSQFVISSWGGSRHPPYAFTEQGVSMLSSVLRSEIAVNVNIEIMRAFVKFREQASTKIPILQKVDELENRVSKHDQQLQQVFQAIREIIQPNVAAKRRIGIKNED